MESLYVCLFSNGHIKVGRSKNPLHRVREHAQRVSCMGLSLIRSASFDCAGDVAAAEASLIARCAKAATKQHKAEWFDGLIYEAVKEWALEAIEAAPAAPVKAKEDKVPHADWPLVDALGGPAKAAARLNTNIQRVHNWKLRGIPSRVKLDHPDLFLPELFAG